MSEATARLARAGFGDSFQARSGQLISLANALPHAPEDLWVREIVRFEGESDPADAAVLFALCSRDGVTRGTFVAGYGASTDAEAAAAVSRLDASHSPDSWRPRRAPFASD